MFTSASAVMAAGGGARLTAGVSGASTGFQEFAFGSILPSPFLTLGDECNQVSTSDASPDLATIDFETGTLPAGFWNTCTIIGVFVGGQATQIWDRVGDSFAHLGNVGNNTRWQSNSVVGANDLMVNGNVYTVKFT